MSSLLSDVFVAFSIVAVSPSVIVSWLASSDVFVIIVGGTSLCFNSSCVVFVGFTRLTQISFYSPPSVLYQNEMEIIYQSIV